MTALGFSLVVALGSAIAAAIAMPHEDLITVEVFIVFNAVFAALGYSVAEAAVHFFRDMNAWKR